jgi:hypothetical protein
MAPSHAIERRIFVFDMIPKNSIGCEIGVWVGQFSYQILTRTNPKMLHLIDAWKWSRGFNREKFKGERITDQKVMDKVYEYVMKNHGNKPNVKIHRGKSQEIYKEFEDGYFDWIYVDASHTFRGVYADLSLYYPKVKKNGIIIGDDWGNKNVRKAAKQFTEEKNIKINSRESQYWFKKEKK